MRAFVLGLLVLLSPVAVAQPVLKATQVAEFADGLSQPHDAAFSPDGRLIYVTDMRNSRVRVLEAMTLKPVGTFGERELSNPHDAEFDRAGRLLVADTGNDRVAIYEVNGAQAKLVGELKGLAGPEGVAVAPDGRVHRHQHARRHAGRVSRRQAGAHRRQPRHARRRVRQSARRRGGGRRQRLRRRLGQRPRAGVRRRASGTAPPSAPRSGCSGPKYLAFDGDRIWLADEDNHRILLLDRRHQLLGVLGTGKRGRGAGEFYKPEAVLARAPYVWVIDTYNDRVVLLRVE